MSFGFSIGDFVLITQLASNVVQNARKACGVHDGLTREVTCLYVALQRLESEASRSQSLLNSTGYDRKDELATLIQECSVILQVLSEILEKYNALSEEKRSITKLWQRVKFGNGEMQDLSKIRLQLVTYTSAITIFINALSLGSQGKVEEYMTLQGGELQRMRRSLDWIVASLQASNGNAEGSILTYYTDDDQAIWRDFRRELVQQGYSSNFLKKHKETIQNYIHELGQRGALDELTEREVQLVDEVQSHEGAPIPGENSVKSVELPVPLSEPSVSAAAEIPALNAVGRDGNGCSEEASSAEPRSAWSDDDFYNHPSQKRFLPTEAESRAEYMGEREVHPVNTSSSGRDNIGERYTGRLSKRRSPSINGLEESKKWDLSDSDSDSDMSDHQKHNVGKKSGNFMTLSELEAELKITNQESEDVRRKLRPYWDELHWARATSLRSIIKQIIFRREQNVRAGVPLESSEPFKSLIYRQDSIREHKASIERQIAMQQNRPKKAVSVSMGSYESNFNATTNVRRSNHSNHTGIQNLIPLAPLASLPKLGTLRRVSGISGRVPNMPHENDDFSISRGRTERLDVTKIRIYDR